MGKIEKKQIPFILLFTSLAVILLIYLGGLMYYKYHYFYGTTVNGINVGGMSINDVHKLYENYDIEIIEKSEQEKEISHVLSGSQIGLQLVDTNVLKNIINNQNAWLWFIKNNKEYISDNLAQYDQAKVEDFINTLNGIEDSSATPSEDAYISQYSEDTGYFIVPESIGYVLDKNKTIQCLNKAIKEMNTVINLGESDCYKEPQIMSDNENLNNSLENMNSWIKSIITYDFDGKQEIVDKDLIRDWIYVKDAVAYIDDNKISQYINGLRKKYDTIFSNREFKTSYGNTINVSGGDYGWWMNAEKEKSELKELIKKGESVKRQPEYYQKALSYGQKDYGNSYVEINLTAQHLFVYKDGQRVLESDFVSGDQSNGFSTPAGTYSLTYKEQMSQLVGENYATPVSYWMPFNGNIGMHDALWRDKFGAQLYKKSGSHGCINLPYNIVKQIYSYVDKGFPVICYELPGTESMQITMQSDQNIVQAVEESINLINSDNTFSLKRRNFSRKLYNQLNQSQKQMVSNYQMLLDAEKK